MQYCRCDRKIDDQHYGINDGGNKRTCHHGGVKTDALGCQGQECANNLCYHNTKEYRDADDECDDEIVLQGCGEDEYTYRRDGKCTERFILNT